MKRPRKRLTQTLAEKSTVGGTLYRWTSVLGKAYTYAPVPSVWAALVEKNGVWTMAVKLNGQKFHGERPTLEAAYKATANLIYKHAKEYWLRMDGRVVSANFADFLKGEV